MRLLSAIVAAAAILIAGALPAAAADPDGAAAAATTKPVCHCAPAAVHHRMVRHARYRVRRWRYRRPLPVIAAAPPPLMLPPVYDQGIPSPRNPAYDRGMVLHFRSPVVTGVYLPDPGYPETPPIVAEKGYRFPWGRIVYQYDGLTGEYIQLSQADAQLAWPAPPAPAPTPAAAAAPPPAPAPVARPIPLAPPPPPAQH